MFDESDEHFADAVGVDVVAFEQGATQPARQLDDLGIGEVLHPAHDLAGSHGGRGRGATERGSTARAQRPVIGGIFTNASALMAASSLVVALPPPEAPIVSTVSSWPAKTISTCPIAPPRFQNTRTPGFRTAVMGNRLASSAALQSPSRGRRPVAFNISTISPEQSKPTRGSSPPHR